MAHAYLHTRVSLMARRLLKGPTLMQVIDKTLAESRGLFEATGAQTLVSDDPVQSRRSMEQRRVSLLLNDVLIFSRALHGNARDFLLYWTHNLELANLKSIIRGRVAGQTPAAIREQLLDMGPFATLPVEALLRAENELEVLRLLDNTPFAEIASQARRVLEQKRDLFFLDTSFDRRFYSGLVKRADQVRVHDPEAFRSLIAAVIDGTNLVWLLRYRFVYQLTPAETYYLLIPADYRLSGRRLKRLTGLDTLEQLLAALPAPLRDQVAGCGNPDDVQGRVEAATRRLAESVIARSSSGFARAFAYLLLRDQDLRMLRGLVRGHLLGVDPATRRQGLRLSQETGEAPRV
ncbi:MAG: V-type ATPase subunit [Betaproteobacteria bacterium]|nr:V-type ATPase subunit [Betaproteobacteria bacterium]